MYSETDFEKLWFFYKTEGQPRVFPSILIVLFKVFLISLFMIGFASFRKAITQYMALAIVSLFFYFRIELKKRLLMNKSEFYSEFLFRYQTEGVSDKVSINTFYLREGVDYGSFIRWCRDNKKRLREAEMEEIRISRIHVTDSLSDNSVSCSALSDPGVMNVLSFHLKMTNGIEISKENVTLGSITTLLQSLSKLC